MKNNAARQNPSAHLPLSPVMYQMLLSLTNDRELHGYGIKLEVEERTNGGMDLDPGTIYGYLKKMHKAGLIHESGQREDEEDNRRRYYRLTEFGARVLHAEFERMEESVKLGRARGVPKLKEV